MTDALAQRFDSGARAAGRARGDGPLRPARPFPPPRARRRGLVLRPLDARSHRRGRRRARRLRTVRQDSSSGARSSTRGSDGSPAPRCWYRPATSSIAAPIAAHAGSAAPSREPRRRTRRRPRRTAHRQPRSHGHGRRPALRERGRVPTRSSTSESESLRERVSAAVATRAESAARSAGERFDRDKFRDRFMAETPLGLIERQVAFGPEGDYGRWLRAHDTVARINGVLFIHGGISPAAAALGCEGINETVARRTEGTAGRCGSAADVAGDAGRRPAVVPRPRGRERSDARRRPDHDARAPSGPRHCRRPHRRRQRPDRHAVRRPRRADRYRNARRDVLSGRAGLGAGDSRMAASSPSTRTAASSCRSD